MPIGTGLALAIGLGMSGAQAASSIYSSKSARGAHDKEIDAQERQAQRDAELTREMQTRDLDFRRGMWTDYSRAHAPSWQMGGRVLQSLYDMATGGSGGGGGASMPAPQSAPPMQSLSSYAGVPSAPRMGARTPIGAEMPQPQPARNPMEGLMSLMQMASMGQPAAGR